MEKMKKILNERKCLKLVCGAGNEDIKEVEKLAYVFSSAGFNMIDVCAKKDVIDAAKNGILKTGKYNETAICVSIGLCDDIHVSKAVINGVKCTLCGNCVKVCAQNAIYNEDEKFAVDERKCIGCLKCLQACNRGSIVIEHKYKQPYAMLLPLISEGIDCVEFHCSSENEEMILEGWNKIKSIYNGVLSICLDRSKIGDEKIISILKQMIDNNEDIIIQADGNPMTGGEDDYKSTLQTVAFAELIQRSNLPNFLILSGGTNSKSSKLAKECSVNISGVALGSYARKLVKDYIDSADFSTNELIQKTAIKTAENLAENIKAYF